MGSLEGSGVGFFVGLRVGSPGSSVGRCVCAGNDASTERGDVWRRDFERDREALVSRKSIFSATAGRYAALFASGPVAPVQRRQHVRDMTPQRAVLLLINALDRDRCREANPNPIYQSGQSV